MKNFKTLGRQLKSMVAQYRMDRRISRRVRAYERGLLHRSHKDRLRGFAEEIGASPEQVSFFFRNVRRTTFDQWLKTCRIKDAMETMRIHPEWSLQKTGGLVGYSDKSNFKRHFKEIAGCNPVEWRERLRKQASYRRQEEAERRPRGRTSNFRRPSDC